MQPDSQIDILITRFLSGEASPEEAMELQDWITESAANKIYFMTCSKFFVISSESAVLDSKKLAWEKVKAAIIEKNSSTFRLITWRMAGIAASIVFIIGLGFLLKNRFGKVNHEIVYQSQTLPRTISLKDSTKINLLPNSSITTTKEYDITNRKIALKGSASFFVKHNDYKPFIIDMATLHIKDLGTIFDIATTPSDDTILIHVTESRVFVYDDFGSSDSLRAGENAIYSKSQKKLQVFHIAQAAADSQKDAEIKNPVVKNKTDLFVSSADSISKNILSSSPGQKLDRLYTPGGDQVLTFNDSSALRRIMDDMHKDGLIKNEETERTVTFKINNNEFIINGKIQSDAVFLRYKQKYSPPINADKGWSWCHNLNCPPAKK